jgi:glycine/D-amino acid oxidase-like deaminating enzyme
MQYDVIIIGAGIAGASTAYFLNRAGLSVLVLEKDTICSGGSNPAGAFLSPKISKPSPYKSYLNDAFEFSTNFYKENFPELFYQCGLKKIPLNFEDIKRCKSYEPFIDFSWEKLDDGYFFKEAGIINPVKLCREMLKDIEVRENYHVLDISNLSCKYLIFATGSDKIPTDITYIETKNIAGYRYDVEFKDFKNQKFNTHKDLSISAFYNNCVAIGATHIKPSQVEDLKEQAENDTFGLLAKAQRLQKLENLKVLKTYIGYRNTTFDYFPIVGKLINEKETLKKYPYIRKGTKVPTEKYIMNENIYIHGALGSRGFVYAPYNAKLLSELILNDKAIQENLSPIRLFKKWAKKLS